MSERSAGRRPAHPLVEQTWWEILIGGVVLTLATSCLLWVIAILGWMLEGPPA